MYIWGMGIHCVLYTQSLARTGRTGGVDSLHHSALLQIKDLSAALVGTLHTLSRRSVAVPFAVLWCGHVSVWCGCGLVGLPCQSVVCGGGLVSLSCQSVLSVCLVSLWYVVAADHEILACHLFGTSHVWHVTFLACHFVTFASLVLTR